MHRFFLPADWISQSTAVITGKIIHQLRDVLRLGIGDHITILDNSGWQYEVELMEVGAGKIEGAVISKNLAAGEPRTSITLYQALLKGSNFEVVLQKCTEIGVTDFVPMLCERCVAGEPTSNRISRWKTIILEAAEQSRRGRLPGLHDVIQFNDARRLASGIVLLPWEGERLRDIGDVLKSHSKAEKPQKVSILIGPEGGFSSQEVEFALNCGTVPVSLGPRILRAETAGLVAAAITLYEFGDLDNKT